MLPEWLHGSVQRQSMFPSTTISMAIDRPYKVIYAFLSDPATLPLWTEGLLHAALTPVSEWVWATLHEGRPVTIHFTPPNPLGVLDISVLGDDVLERHYRVRVFPNGEGTELCCTVLQSPGEDDAHFASECEWLRTDLNVLRAFLEGR